MFFGGGGGWQRALGDSWRRAAALRLQVAADSGDICASCCSTTVETVKVNYNINDGAPQAVVPYYGSIIPHVATHGGAPPAAAVMPAVGLTTCSMWLRLVDERVPSLPLHLSSERPAAPRPRRRRHFGQHLFDPAAFDSRLESIWQGCRV